MKNVILQFLALALALAARAQDFTTGLIAQYPLSEESGQTAADIVGGNSATVTGTARWLKPGMEFTGGQYAVTPVAAASGLTNAMTLVFWCRLDSTAGTQAIVHKDTFDLVISAGEIWLSFNYNVVTGGTPYYSHPTGIPMTTGVWRQLALTSDGSTIRTYVDGVPAVTIARNIVFGTSGRGLHLGAWPSGQFPFHGALRDVRVYNRALSAADLSKLGSILPANYAGLWIGRASLNEVKEAATGNWSSSPAFEETVLLHINEAGSCFLLNEATLMQTRTANPVQLVVTQPALLPNYDGVTLRGGRRIGQRFSSATMLLPSDTVPLSKAGAFFSATFTLPADSPVNPFRHKYHPDLGTGRALTRTAGLSFAAGESPSDNTLAGTFMESFTGLHKTTLEARGPVTFTRVSTSGKLNQP